MVLGLIHVHVFLFFEVGNNSTDKREKIAVLGEGSTQVLDETWITFEATYSISFTESRNDLCYVCIIMEATVFFLND